MRTPRALRPLRDRVAALARAEAERAATATAEQVARRVAEQVAEQVADERARLAAREAALDARESVLEATRAAVREELAAHEAARPHLGPDEWLRTPRVFGDPARLSVHPSADVNDALFNLSSGTVTVEQDAFFGHAVSVLTGTHDTSRRGRARQKAIPDAGRDVVIRRGAWVASHAVVQGPCVVGEDAVVMPGAVVTRDVPAGAVVGGVPARVVGAVPEHHGPSDTPGSPAPPDPPDPRPPGDGAAAPR